ncbi:MAG TPA: DnaJ domain-containing protein [Fimbriimonadaceae bacterium]|nr:DnaJ domain-containing protein [Fimbriimonadaceae bacterium]HRJ32534.1 DnaJ domain-containing protein [Fimbriimonadaceae bacterium]
MKPTHYEQLGVGTDADESAIRAAYRRLVKLVHPDRSSAPDAQDRFIRVQEAYEVLTDPVRRASYDRLLELERAGPPARPSASSTPTSPTQAQDEKPPRPPTGSAFQQPSDLLRLTQLSQKGLLIEAEKLAKKLVQTQPREALPHSVLGDVARHRGRLREAVSHYSYAIQLDPRNPTYTRKHAEVHRILARQEPMGTLRRPQASPAAILTGVFATLACAIYVAKTQEPPLFPEFGPLSTLTLGCLMGLIVSGIALGAALAVANQVDPTALHSPLGEPRLSMAWSLGLIAGINFWLAGLAFGILAGMRRAAHPSMVKLLATVAVIPGVFALAAAWQPGTLSPGQVLLWGGNFAYFGAILGWQVVESFR